MSIGISSIELCAVPLDAEAVRLALGRIWALNARHAEDDAAVYAEYWDYTARWLAEGDDTANYGGFQQRCWGAGASGYP